MNLKNTARITTAIVALGLASPATLAESLIKRLDRLEKENWELRQEFRDLQKEREKEHAAHDQDTTPTAPTSPSSSAAADIPPPPPKPSPAKHRAAAPGLVNLNSTYTYMMLDPTTAGKSKPLALLHARQDGAIADSAVYLGGALTAVVDYQMAN